MTEEKYIIDEKGEKKILEINKSVLDGKDDLENYKNNKPLNKNERYYQKNPKIIVITNNNNVRHILKDYKRNNKTPDNNLIKNKIPLNYNKKDNNIYKIKCINIHDSNKDKESDIFYNNNNYSYTNPINNLKYQSRNNTSRILMQTQTSPNHILSNYKISYINNHDKTNNNHFYHEIKKLSKPKKNKDSKTIYHDYSNRGKEIILDNSYKNAKVIYKNKNILNKKVINRSYFNSYIQIPNNLLKNNIERNLNKKNIIFRNENYKNKKEIYLYNRNNNTNNSYMINSNINERYYN